jgi:hypothetical protein
MLLFQKTALTEERWKNLEEINGSSRYFETAMILTDSKQYFLNSKNWNK